MKKKPLILISNDDGIEADGIQALWRQLRKFGDVVVVAPLTQQSVLDLPVCHKIPIDTVEHLDRQ